MKKILYPIILVLPVIVQLSCTKQEIEANFEDQEKMSIYDYIIANEEKYSSFLKILNRGGIDKTLEAYNPNGIGYTLFLPDNNAVDNFIEENDAFSSLDDLLNDSVYVRSLSRYHVVNAAIDANDFPFGALPEFTLSDDFLTVSFIIETDTAYYKINNQAPVIQPNVELSNGFIHIISQVLNPITFTTYNWLEQNQGYSIFKDAVDITGLSETFNLDIKKETYNVRPFTLLIEHDSVFNKQGIFSLADLEKLISPDNADYTNSLNPLNGFVKYHLLAESWFIDDFVGNNTNYTTYSEIPLLIDGTGIDIKINKGKQIFDTIVATPDTTFIDYVGFDYDASNVISQSGVIHFIDQIMKQQKPSRAQQIFEFYNEPFFSELRLEAGEYLIEDSAALQVIKWSGTDLFFVKSADENSPAWSGDYLYLDGDFSISYTIPKIVQGSYTVFLRVDAANQLNALVEIFVDGKKIGGNIDLTTIGDPSNTLEDIELGDVNFLKYEQHVILIKTLIPGRFIWDYIKFVPL